MDPETLAAGLEKLNAMSTGEDSTTPVAENAVDTNTVVDPATGGGHPAWQEILDAIPASLRDNVRPQLEAWDKGVQEKISKVHSEYEPFKPFVGTVTDQESVQNALTLYNLLSTDPERVYKELATAYGYGATEQGQAKVNPVVDSEEEIDLSSTIEDPRIAALQKQQDAIMASMEASKAAEDQRNADLWIDSQLTVAKIKFQEAGVPFDDTTGSLLLTAAANKNSDGKMSPEIAFNSAITDVLNFANSIRTAPRPGDSAPKVVPTGGGVPSTAFDPNKLDSKGRIGLGVELLNQLRANG
jgi:hypothetical protein